MADDKKVGYGKPPEHSRFKKGQSGNRQGRKPKLKSIRKLVERELDQMVEVREGTKMRRMSKREALVATIVNDAIKGKAGARQLMMQIEREKPPAGDFAPDEGDIELLQAWAEQRFGQEAGVLNEASDSLDEDDT